MRAVVPKDYERDFNYTIVVSQVSNLGPLIFDDITNTSDVLDFIFFADDTTIHKDLASQNNLIHRELLEVSN